MILHSARSAINSPSFGKKASNDDIMDFSSDMQKHRSNNSFHLRRHNKSWSLPSKKSQHYDLEQPKMDFITFLAIIESNDSKKIVQLSDEITKCCSASKEYFDEITSSLEAVKSFTNAFVSEESPDVMKSMILALSSMFPLLSSKIMCAVIDCDIANKLYDQFNPITQTIIPSINLIITISKYCSYGRNSFLAMGIHELLIQTAMETSELCLTIRCCEALQSIFENPEKVDYDHVENYIGALVKLLSIQDDDARVAILRTLCAIANQMPSMVNHFIEEGAHILVLRFLQSAELQSSSLCLVSKLCYTNEHLKIQEMVDNGLVEILFELIMTEHAASVLHVFSRICTKIPDKVIPALPSDFINQLVEICNTSSFAVMKEATYLLTILINREGPNEIVDCFMFTEIIEILVDMLSSSQDDIILPCLNAIDKILKAAKITSKVNILMPMLNETDIEIALSNLEQNVNSISTIGVKATKITEMLNSFDD